MKKKFLLLMAILIVSNLINAQTAIHRFAIDFSVIKNEYKGDFGNGIFEFNRRWYPAGGLSLSAYLAPSLDMGLQGSFGQYGFRESTANRFAGTKLDGSIFAHYKLNNGYILKKDSKLSPFISAGIGVATYGIDATVDKSGSTPGLYPTIINKGYDIIVPVGAGLKYQISKRIAIQYQYLYNFTNSDIHDQNRGPNFFGSSQHPSSKAGNDIYGQHSLSVSFNFGKIKDEDNDGVWDRFDKCPNTPLNVKVDKKGCPIDMDGDGVPDYLDQCSNTPKNVKVDAKGCPLDQDGDGVPDYLDKSQNTPAGVKVDASGQAIDSDKDGVPDYLDKCPDVPGIQANNGCPEVTGEMVKIFDEALHGIQFESGKDIIMTTSYPILNQVVDLMVKNPSFILEINGHTDSTGDDAKNLILSQNRSDAIKEYLIYQGVNPSRLKAQGFGETVPVGDNSTKEGRLRNRRVEFKAIF